jgi:hypothetical protein
MRIIKKEIKMKKLSIMMFAVLVVGYVSAAVSWDWSTDSLQFANVALGTPSDGDGAGWYAQVIGGNTTGGNTSATFGWSTGFGYYINSFAFNADEGASVSMVLWDSATSGIGHYLQSAAVPLPTGLLAPPSEVSFNFSGSTWQAVPEPATALLFAIGGFGAWLIRRNKLSSKYGTDA